MRPHQVRKKPRQNGLDTPSPGALSVRLHALRSISCRKNKIQDIMEALISSGCNSLDDQARALGLPRSTVWTMRRNSHKLGRLSAKTLERIVANPETPPRVLYSVQKYVREKLDAFQNHGHKQWEQIGIRNENKN
jgi:hypothetical protein